MTDINKPATLAQLLHIADTNARATGFLIALALRHISPEGADRFYNAVSSLPQDGSDFDMFIEKALDGIESARYDTED